MAAYFAASDTKTAYFGAADTKFQCKFFAVWGFNYDTFIDRTGKRLWGEDYDDYRASWPKCRMAQEVQEKANQLLDREASGSLVIPVDPFHQNERTMAQQGLFLLPCCPARTFSENFADLFLHCDVKILDAVHDAPIYNPTKHHSGYIAGLTVVKLLIPFEQRLKTIIALRRMNIHEASLFPGLDGFARSLSFYTHGDD